MLGCAGPRPLGDQPGLSGSAAIRCEPADAKLWVDGVERGTAQDFDGHQQTLRLAAGPHRLSLEHQGYRSFEAELIVGDFRQTVAVKLLPLTD